MCHECRSYFGHDPRCPNAPEPNVCIKCDSYIEDDDSAELTKRGLVCGKCNEKEIPEEVRSWMRE